MESQSLNALLNLALPLELIGLFLAWSDLRKWSWIKRAESFFDQMAESRKTTFGGFRLGFIGLEFFAIIIAVFLFYFFDFNLDGYGYILVYGIALILLVAFPFICHSLNILGKDRAIGSIGVLFACVGVAIEVIQKFGLST